MALLTITEHYLLWHYLLRHLEAAAADHGEQQPHGQTRGLGLGRSWRNEVLLLRRSVGRRPARHEQPKPAQGERGSHV